MGYKYKTDKQYQIEYYIKNKYRRQEYYLRNRDELLLLRQEYYLNKVRERNKNKNNVVISSNKIIISIIED